MIENQHNNHWGSQDTQPGGGGGVTQPEDMLINSVKVEEN